MTSEIELWIESVITIMETLLVMINMQHSDCIITFITNMDGDTTTLSAQNQTHIRVQSTRQII